MEQVTPVLFLIGNCCLMPLLFFAAGYWLAKGMPGSPIAVVRRRGRATTVDDLDPFEEH